MDRLESMTVLLAVVEAGSLSGAGRKLGMPLATVSRKLSELEAHLKARLLRRSTRKLSLSDAGAAYVAACKRILEDVQEAERAVSGEFLEPKGDLVITAPIVFGRLHILPIVIEFLQTFPQVDLRLVLGDRVLNLLEDPIDVAVRIGHLPDSSLNATRLGSVRQVVCGSPGYFARHGMPQQPADLSQHACISFEALMAAHIWLFNSNTGESSISVHARLSVNTAEAAIDAAMAGMGVTRVLSYQVEDAKRCGMLQTVLTDFEPEALPVSLVYERQGRLPLKLRAFLDFAGPRLRKRLGDDHG